MLAVNWRKGGKLLKRQDSAIFCNLFYDDCFNDECDCCDLPLSTMESLPETCEKFFSLNLINPNVMK